MVTSRLLFVSGKGGTGKSAVAAAMAIERARIGQSVLAIDMGAGEGLGAHLRHPGLAYRPIDVRPGLSAMAMDRTKALDEYLKLQLRVPQGAPTRQLAGMLGVLADTAPGVREIISIGKPVYETWKNEWDVVIVDAPPLGQMQSYLRAPTTIAELVPTGNVQRQASRLEDTLKDPDITSVVLVATPAELPVRETIQTLDVMTSESLCAPPVVAMNRVVDRSGLTRRSLEHLPDGPIHDAAVLQLAIEAEQGEWRSKLDSTTELPFLRGVFTPGEVAEQLADSIGSIP